MLTPVLSAYKNAYTGLSRSTWLLAFVMLINRSGTMVVPFLGLYLLSMGYSVIQYGIAFVFFGFGALTGAYFGGKLTDKIGFYPVQIITLLGGGVMFFILGQMKSYHFICIFTFLLAFINEAFRPANSTAVAFYSKLENRTRSYALNRLAINIGWSVGSGIGGVLAEINYELLFWVDGITNIAAAFLIIFFLKPVKASGDHKEENDTSAVSPFKDKTYMFFIILTIFFAICFFQMFTTISPYLNTELHFSESLIGFMLATNGVIIAILEMVLVYKLEGKRRQIDYISIGILLVGIAYLMLNIPGMGPVLAFSMITILTFGEIFSMPFMNTFWLSRTQAGNRGQYAALYTMAWSAAQTFCALLGTQIAARFGYSSLWFTIGGICIIVSFLMRKIK